MRAMSDQTASLVEEARAAAASLRHEADTYAVDSVRKDGSHTNPKAQRCVEVASLLDRLTAALRTD